MITEGPSIPLRSGHEFSSTLRYAAREPSAERKEFFSILAQRLPLECAVRASGRTGLTWANSCCACGAGVRWAREYPAGSIEYAKPEKPRRMQSAKATARMFSVQSD